MFSMHCCLAFAHGRASLFAFGPIAWKTRLIYRRVRPSSETWCQELAEYAWYLQHFSPDLPASMLGSAGHPRFFGTCTVLLLLCSASVVFKLHC